MTRLVVNSTREIDIITKIPNQMHLLVNYYKLAIFNERGNVKKEIITLHKT